MSTQVLVPPLGQTVDTLTFVRWLKQEGEQVHQGEPLFEIETDKANLEVEAPASGILSGITARAGQEVAVLSAIGVIEERVAELVLSETKDGKSQGASGRSQGASGRSQGASGRSQVAGGRAQDAPIGAPNLPLATFHLPPKLFASPRARVLAEGEGVPLAAVVATGPEGAIVERDVRAFLQRSEVGGQRTGDGDRGSEAKDVMITPVAKRMAEEAGLDWRTLAGTGPGGRITREDVEAALAPTSNYQSPITNNQSPPPTLPFTGIRSLIAERMTRSHTQTAPVTLTAEADATALVQLRQDLKADGVEASYNDLLLVILAKALAEHPRLNASLAADGIQLWQRIDIGLAVDSDRGLLAPVVRDVAGKGLAQIAAETKALAERARAGQCTPDELRGGTFTLTNLGMFGVDAFTPLINLPETAILGLGRIKTQPAWVNDHVEPRQMVWLSLTFDHRLVDGGLAARFLQRLVQLVAKPHLLLA